MARYAANVSVHEPMHKRTSQGGRKPKMSSMNKHSRRNFKRYRGQGK